MNFLRANAALAKGPILEIGSRDYGNTPDYRGLFPGARYVGADLAAGKGVDLVLDAAADRASVERAVGGRKFGSVICCSVLEHCRDPFGMAANIEHLLEDGGTLFVSVPFSWEYHAFPDDYWRFSPSGVKLLFPGIAFDDARTAVSTSNPGEMKPLGADDPFFKIDLSPRAGLKKKRYGWGTALALKALKAVPALRPVLGHVYVMPPVLVNMVGRKRKP
jgi:hypothetical protein